MAKNTSCDKCGLPAVTTAKFETTTTTALEFDLCEGHVAEMKKIMRAFSGQDAAEVSVIDDKVIVTEERVLDDQS